MCEYGAGSSGFLLLNLFPVLRQPQPAINGERSFTLSAEEVNLARQDHSCQLQVICVQVRTRHISCRESGRDSIRLDIPKSHARSALVIVRQSVWLPGSAVRLCF